MASVVVTWWIVAFFCPVEAWQRGLPDSMWCAKMHKNATEKVVIASAERVANKDVNRVG